MFLNIYKAELFKTNILSYPAGTYTSFITRMKVYNPTAAILNNDFALL